mmetsp:Transcript_113037/g.319829  ORF Transcript_113037/g.319829 Transcript_113037/m.319829 type:complete len:261 (+) Transcript_113037:66-848(+)
MSVSTDSETEDDVGNRLAHGAGGALLGGAVGFSLVPPAMLFGSTTLGSAAVRLGLVAAPVLWPYVLACAALGAGAAVVASNVADVNAATDSESEDAYDDRLSSDSEHAISVPWSASVSSSSAETGPTPIQAGAQQLPRPAQPVLQQHFEADSDLAALRASLYLNKWKKQPPHIACMIFKFARVRWYLGQRVVFQRQNCSVVRISAVDDSIVCLHLNGQERHVKSKLLMTQRLADRLSYEEAFPSLAEAKSVGRRGKRGHR